MKINLTKNVINYINKMYDIMEDNKNLSSMFLDILYNSKNIANNLNNKKSYFENIKSMFELDESFLNYYKNYNLNNAFNLLDINEYKNNPYVKKIKLDKVIVDKNHKFENLNYNSFECFLYKNIEIGNDYLEHYKLGYFNDKYSYITLLEDESIWMLITPHEINTMKEAVDKAYGKVITFGLGLGYYAYMCSLKENVESVTIIEKDKKTIELFKEFILPQFKNKEKIIIINDDAIKYCENKIDYDYGFVDIYKDEQDGLVLYIKMYQNLVKQNFHVDYWIEEGMIIILRRALITLLYEITHNLYNECNDTFFDELISKFNEVTKNLSIENNKDIDLFLSIDNIKSLITKIKLS